MQSGKTHGRITCAEPIHTLPNKSADPFRGAFVSELINLGTFERHRLRLFSTGELQEPTQKYVGQEGNAVGNAVVLNRDDVVVSAHRGYGHFLAHVRAVEGLLGKIMGRESGVWGDWGIRRRSVWSFTHIVLDEF